MSSRAPAWFEQKYVAGVKHKLQSAGWLTKPLLNSTGTQHGNQVNWKIAGTGIATERSTTIERRPVMNLDRTMVTATMKAYEANDWINTTDLAQMSEAEQQVVQKSGAMAMGRKFDQLTFGAMDAETTNIATVGNGSAAISILDIIAAKNAIDDIGVGSYEYACALPVGLLTQLELFREFSSSDYVGDEYPLLKAVGARKWKGVTFLPMPSSYFNVPATNQIDCYLWNVDCVGLAPNVDLTSRIDYVATEKAWFCANDMMLAHKVLLTEGVQRLRFATNAALTRPSP